MRQCLAHRDRAGAPRQRPTAAAVAVVVHHERVADALGIEARTSGTKGAQAHRDVEDAIGARPKRCQAPGAVVPEPRRYRASAYAHAAPCREHLQQPATIDEWT